ncbi:MAG: hypothetical protein WBQ31_01460, partial [Candidatus Acidiferrales bacterium]
LESRLRRCARVHRSTVRRGALRAITPPPGLRPATTAAKISYLRAGKSRNPNPQSWTPFHESNSLAQQQP